MRLKTVKCRKKSKVDQGKALKMVYCRNNSLKGVSFMSMNNAVEGVLRCKVLWFDISKVIYFGIVIMKNCNEM